ncbi:hypothetical protein BDB01DRAFT_768544 [Pilobolus umbonatus]|nr:hypothetical protein BDB01DRAFT_768544 [Pilobolus umbonatus]
MCHLAMYSIPLSLSGITNKSGNICIGCRRCIGSLNNNATHLITKKQDISPPTITFNMEKILKSFIKDQNKVINATNRFISSTEGSQFLKGIRCQMKRRKRLITQKESGVLEYNDLPSVDQLRDLVTRSGNRCEVSRLLGLWYPRNSIFTLSFDHIVPISKDGGWDIENIQVVLTILNSVKGNEYNQELLRWITDQ